MKRPEGPATTNRYDLLQAAFPFRVAAAVNVPAVVYVYHFGLPLPVPPSPNVQSTPVMPVPVARNARFCPVATAKY